jgi:hypothetical protein
VLEAQLHGAVAAIVLVHAFGSESVENWNDFSGFVHEPGGTIPIKGQVSGPYPTGENKDLPAYFLWCQQPASE